MNFDLNITSRTDTTNNTSCDYALSIASRICQRNSHHAELIPQYIFIHVAHLFIMYFPLNLDGDLTPCKSRN